MVKVQLPNTSYLFCGIEMNTKVSRMKLKATFIKRGLNEAKIWWAEFHLISFEGLWQLWFSQPLRSWHHDIEILRNKKLGHHSPFAALLPLEQITIFYYSSMKKEKSQEWLVEVLIFAAHCTATLWCMTLTFRSPVYFDCLPTQLHPYISVRP